jgi:branched-chain amino acid aminotransferase
VKIWFNGNVIEEDRPVLAATDRGVLFGDALFETFRTYGGTPFRLERHLARIEDSGVFFKMTLPCPAEAIRKAVRELLAANEMTDAAVRITLTRGAVAGPLGLAESGRENVFMTLRSPGYPEELYHEGVRLIVSTVKRNSFSPLSRHKTANYLDALVARQEAQEAGAEEALMLDETGGVAECTTANIFAVRGGVVWTPPLEAPILPGVTRETVLEICRELGQSACEGRLELEELRGADEAFITNSVMEVMPVRTLAGKPVGTGRPGPVYRRIREAYRRAVLEECGT